MAEQVEPVVAVRAAADVDLAPLTDRLWRARIPHRVIADAQAQLVLVLDAAAALQVQALARALERGDEEPAQAQAHGALGPQGWLRALRRTAARAPVTTAILLAAVALAPLVLVGGPEVLLAALYMVPPAWVSSGAEWSDLFSVLARGEVWRLLTPCLLHFSLAHLLMNSVLFWTLGRRIERALGSWAAIASFCVLGVASNIAQFVLAGSALFGGLSGVVMGQLGFLLLMARRSRDPVLRVQPALAIGVLLSSAVFATGITEVIGLHIANTAHWAGFAAGVLLATVWPVRRRHAQ